VSLRLGNKAPARIEVRQDGEWVGAAPGIPTLSSAQSPWRGALLERHVHGPYTTNRHQHVSYFVSLHLSDPAPFTWQSQGRQGKKIIEPGSIIVVSRGTEDWVSFPSPVKRILLNVEPGVFQKAFPDEDPDRDVELVSQWGIHDRHVEFVLRVERTEKPSKGGHPAAATKRSEYIFKLLLS
jgi:hypothetical protein